MLAIRRRIDQLGNVGLVGASELLDVFRDLVENWGCSIVFSTATQPAFRRSPLGLTHGIRADELSPNRLRD